MKLDAEAATDLAMKYIATAGYRGDWVKAHACDYDESSRTWRVTLDVGVMVYDFRQVVVDDETGRVKQMGKVPQP